MHISIIYSSGGGNTFLVVQKVAEMLSEQNHRIEIIQAINATQEHIHHTDLLIFAAPTYDHGILHAPFERFLENINTIDLNQKPCAVIGLGDAKYDQEYTIQSAIILETFINDHAGVMLIEPLRIHKSPLPHLTTTITQRSQLLSKKINA